jgi:hypothetical protein
LYNTEAKSYYPGEESAPRYTCPAGISPDLEAELKRLAVAAFEAIGALDVSRVDFRLGADGQPYLMEINTLPGLNPSVSDLSIVARVGGMPYVDLINEILNLALARYGKSVNWETGKSVSWETGKLVDWEWPTNLPIYQPTNLPVYRSTDLPIYQSTKSGGE